MDKPRAFQEAFLDKLREQNYEQYSKETVAIFKEVFQAIKSIRTSNEDKYEQLASKLALFESGFRTRLGSTNADLGNKASKAEMNLLNDSLSDFKKSVFREIASLREEMPEIPEMPELSGEDIVDRVSLINREWIPIEVIKGGSSLISRGQFEDAIVEIGGKLTILEKRTAKGYGALGGGSEGTGSLFLSRLRDVDLSGLTLRNGKYVLGSGSGGGGTGIQSVVAGTGISVDSTDPNNPIVSSTAAGPGGSVNNVQLNDGAGGFTGSNGLTYDSLGGLISVPGFIASNGLGSYAQAGQIYDDGLGNTFLSLGGNGTVAAYLNLSTGGGLYLGDDQIVNFDLSGITADRTATWPDKDGTIAYLDDIPVAPVDGGGTTNEITYWVDSNTVGSLTTATYPTLTELSYVKGVTSSIQTQLNAKGDVTGPAASIDNSPARFDGTTGKVLQGYTSGAPTFSDTGLLNLQNGLTFTSDNTYNIGATTTTLRPANVYVAATVNVANNVSLTATSLRFGTGSTGMVLWNGTGRIGYASDGVFKLANDANNDFGRMQFGGTSTSFPALKRSTVNLQVRLADDSAFSDLEVLDEVYGSGWNGSNEVPTKNAVYDKIESIIAAGGVTSVSGTTNRITSTGGTTPVIDISATFEALLGKVANRIDQNNAATTSAQLATVISDETGSGPLVFATSPSLTTPNIGAASGSSLTLSGTASPTYAAGKLVYDTDNESLTFFNNESNVSLQIGQENWIRVINNTGSTIANGSAVYLNGASGGLPTIALAQANAAATTIGAGLATQSIANGAIGYVTFSGLVRGFDTSAFTAGATVFISATTPGALTSTAPSAPNYRYRVGIVGTSNAVTGTVHVTPSTAALGNGTANQLFGMNTAGTAQEVKSLLGTTNRISVTPGTNTLTLDIGSTVALTTGNLSQFAATTSAQLAGIISDETGSGQLVFGTNPSFTTGASIAGDPILTRTSTDTLTNKRITKRTGGTTSSATPTINTDNVDYYELTAQTANITSFTTNLSGTPTNAQTLWISITGTASRTIAWGASFEASTTALPTTTSGTSRLDVGFVWNTVTSKWRCIAVS